MAEIDGTMDKNLRSRKSPCTAGNMANVEGDVLNGWEKGIENCLENLLQIHKK